jgi:hypothetical protein
LRPLSFLGRAKKLIGGFTPPDASSTKPQYYGVHCPEGHLLRGARTEGYQAIRCPTCGEGVFILPRSPLPDPPAPPGAIPKPRAVLPARPTIDDAPIEYQDAPPQFVEAEADAEIEWEDAEPGDEDQGAEVELPDELIETPAPKSPPRPPSPKTNAPSRRPEPEPEEEDEYDPFELTAKRKGRRRRSRTTLVVAAVVAMVAMTVGLILHRQHRQNLPRIAETNRAGGLSALKNGVFDVAKQKLATAADALESLGDDDAASIRQSADEAAILADLSSLSMEEIVEEVATKEDGPSRFETLYQGRAVILDAEIEDVTDGVPILTYRIIAGTGPRPKTGFVDLTGFRLIADRKKGDHVTFGARLASITLGDDGRWAVAFQPKSGVYLRSPEAWKALESLGWSTETAGSEEVK